MAVDLSHLTEAEMVDDYYASLMDAETCEQLGLQDRADTNRRIMAVIDDEFGRRGIIPPWKSQGYYDADAWDEWKKATFYESTCSPE